MTCQSHRSDKYLFVRESSENDGKYYQPKECRKYLQFLLILRLNFYNGIIKLSCPVLIFKS